VVLLCRKMNQKKKQLSILNNISNTNLIMDLKKGFLLLLILFFSLQSFANHLKGGWIQYEYIGPGASPNTSKYTITVKQYLDCSSTATQRDASVYLGIFDSFTNTQYGSTLTILLSGTDKPNKTDFSVCLNNPPIGKVCYYIDRYTTTIDLPDNTHGYTLSVQRCCRILNIINLSGNSNSIGVTYTNKIPGTIQGIDYSRNSSPAFAQKDTAIVCFKTPFTFDFSATDKDNDSLSYVFCDGLTGGDMQTPAPNPPSIPPYAPVPYTGGASGFTGFSPLGPTVKIDPLTGIISGIAPGIVGDYVIAVCAYEFRAGVLIGITKKEIHLTVADCSLSAAELKPTYITCNGFVLGFQNESTNSTIAKYLWSFGESKFPATNTSSLPTPIHTYKDTGTYSLKLVVTSTGGCLDSATAFVKIYPGFVPDFKVVGNCYLNNFQFLDNTTTKYGIVDSWRWDFGDATIISDTATSKDSAWKYISPQTTQARLIVTNSKGCIDTISKAVNVLDKPILKMAFKDSLICSIDTLALKATISGGLISFTPDNLPNKSRIINANTSNPLVFPKDSTRYFVVLNDNGCMNYDTVTVNVLQYISVDAGLDSAICKTDTFRLKPISQALSYLWKSSTGAIIANTKFPLVQPLTSTRYYVTANLGRCQAIDSVFYKVSPYPLAVVMPDTTICFGSRVLIQGFAIGSNFNWKPTNSLINSNSFTPTAGPSKTTQYILTATDTIGCPKPVSDTILITVIPTIVAYAGRDTSIVADQALQLIATGGTRYFWSPSTGLSNPNIANPIALLGANIDSITYKVSVFDNNGCTAVDDIKVRIYKSQPDIFVPTAFTPDKDGKNDILKPITVGIVQLHYFSIYNRWGQQVFTTNELGKGWDGNFNGVQQSAGTFVFITEGTDYMKNKIFRKGTTVLIR